MSEDAAESSSGPPSQNPSRPVIYWPGLVPDRWTKELGVDAILARTYRTGRIPASAVEPGTKIVELDRVRAVLTTVQLSYIEDGTRLEVGDTEIATFAIQAEPKVTDPGRVHLVLLTPLRGDRLVEDDLRAHERLQVTAGLLGAMIGRNIQYDLLFECEVDLAMNRITYCPSRSFLNWQVLPTPDVTNENLLQVIAVQQAIERLAPDTRARVILSLRWFFEALHDHGVDSFLRHWVAIETLAMESTHVGPINALLTQSYGMTTQEVVEQFAVGRLQGLRSQIVHHGRMPGFDGRLLDYIALLYQDVLFAVLGLPSRRVALPVAREVVPALRSAQRDS